MTAFDDLTGKTFNKLTALKDNGGGKIYCRCDCGTEKWFNKSNVKRGVTTSCGCTRKGKWESHIKDITGQRFGKLVVLKNLPNGKVLCHCDCGNDKVINKGHLLNGDILSCGCLRKQSANKNKVPFLVDGTNLALIKNNNPTSRSKSGIRGVSWDARRQKWRAQIGFKNKKIALGAFNDIADAIKARKAAEEKYYKPLLNKHNKLSRR